MYQQLFQKQKLFYQTSETKSYRFRITMLKKLYTMIANNIDALQLALQQDLGKAAVEAYMCEIGLVLNSITYTIKHLKKWMKVKKVSTSLANFKGSSYQLKCPYGVCLIISPWNYPVLLSLDPLVGSIAGGNTSILKLSSHSKNVSLLLANLLNQTFKEEYIKALLISGEETDILLENHFDFIFFTGSKKIGKHIMEKASQNLIPVCLELGGKSPCIITKNANIKIACRRVAFGKIINAGQTCVAPDYLIVDETIKEEVLQTLKQEIINFLGETSLTNADYPKIISTSHLERLKALLINQDIYYGGEYNEEKLSPTILDHVSFENEVMKEEIFGPILPVLTYNDLNCLKHQLLKLPSPLAFYIFTENKKEYDDLINTLPFGGGCINDILMHLVSETLPFGGFGESGMGKYHGKYSFDTFTIVKSILKKSTKIDISLRYHPYNRKKLKLIKKILK